MPEAVKIRLGTAYTATQARSFARSTRHASRYRMTNGFVMGVCDVLTHVVLVRV